MRTIFLRAIADWSAAESLSQPREEEQDRRRAAGPVESRRLSDWRARAPRDARPAGESVTGERRTGGCCMAMRALRLASRQEAGPRKTL